MATMASAPMSNANLPSTIVHEKSSIPHLNSDASFSSYLYKKETFASLDLQGQLGKGCEKINKGEISIFAAEKYYNGGSGDGKKAEIAKNHLRKHHPKQLEGKVYIQQAKLQIGPGTPSTVSSASSWNSHKTLLPDSSKEKPRSVGDVLNCKRLLAIFSCKCSCSNEKSVEVDETVMNKRTSSNCERNGNNGGNFTSKVTTEEQAFVSQDQISTIGTKQTEIQSEKLEAPVLELPREDCFTFPVVSSGIDNLTIDKPVFQEEEGQDRTSLEVFGSPLSDDDGARALSLERRVAMLTLSFTKSMKGIAATSVNSGISDDDLESDTSSDLFEIENFTNDTYPCYKPEQEENKSTSVTDTTYHQPTEASITTENTSCGSYHTETNSSKKAKELALSDTSIAAKSIVVKKVHKRHLNALLSCNSSKAVNVAEVYKVSENANSKHYRGAPY